MDGEDEDAYRRYMGEVGGDAEDLANVSYDQQLLITSEGNLTFALGGNAILRKPRGGAMLSLFEQWRGR